MKGKIVASIAAALLVGTAGCALNVAAAAQFPHGGGGFHGGGMHFGGGGFHGGGMHFGGFRAPAHFAGGRMHLGGFGGRSPHFASHRFATHRFGGSHFARHFGAHNFAGGNFAGRRSAAGRFASPHYAAGRFGHGPAAMEGRAAEFAGRNARFGAANRGPEAFRHGRFDWRHFDRNYVGWAGPVFWPYAYNDLFSYTYWPYDDYWPYDNLFWAYGYDDLFAGVLLPYNYGAYYGYAQAPAPAPGGGPVAEGQQPSGPVPASSTAEFCQPAQPIAGTAPIDRIADAVHPTADQRAKLDALGKAEARAENELRSSCGAQTPATAAGRLDAVQTKLQDMLNAVNIVRGPLDDFYGSLSDEQKARFDQLGADQRSADEAAAQPASLTQFCGPQNAVPVVSVEEIDKAVHPDRRQQAELAALREAATKADDMIVASCPAQSPLTPPGRLDAVRNRLQAMLQAVETVRPALQNFYASLNPDQQAKFDAMGAESGQNKS
jgi:hypothetical protein